VDLILRDLEKTLIALGARPPAWDPLRGSRHPEGLRVVDSVLPPDWERRPLGWKPVWIAPGQTPIEDTQWVLMTYLLQEQMIDFTREISHFVQRYMRQFRYAASQEDQALLEGKLERFLLEGGGAAFAEILRTYAFPEHWKGQRQ